MAKAVRRVITTEQQLAARAVATEATSPKTVVCDPIDLSNFDFMRLEEEQQEALRFYDAWYRRTVHTGQYPWDAPGLPLPGPNFVRHAQEMGDPSLVTQTKVSYVGDDGKKRQKTVQHVKVGQQLTLLMNRALRDPSFTMPVSVRGQALVPVRFIPGHIWGQHAASVASPSPKPVDGPHPAQVMVVGKMPWKDELKFGRNFMGATGEVLMRILSDLKFQDLRHWYVTNILKFMPPDNTTRIAADWLKDCLPLFYQELRLVRPKLILCLGADASKIVLGKEFSVSYMEGRVIEHTYDVSLTPACKITSQALVMTVVHPAQVTRDESQRRTLIRGLSRFSLLTKGKRFDKQEEGVDHRTISNLVELSATLRDIEADPDKTDSLIGMDAEWQGQHAVNEGAYLRTVQVAWKPKHAIVVKLREQGGDYAMESQSGERSAATERIAIDMLKLFILGGQAGKHRFRRKRVAGHFFNSDLEWMVRNGLDIRDAFRVPLWDTKYEELPYADRKVYFELGYRPGHVVPAWLQTKCAGGVDTALATHAVEETAALGLEALFVRYTSAPRYDIQIEDWVKAYCKSRKIRRKDLQGFGDCPDYILCPTPEQCKEHGTYNYAAYDADVTLRIANEMIQLLDCDYEGNNCREAFWESMAANAALFEINTTGVTLDQERLDVLTDVFGRGKDALLGDIQGYLKWPGFNPRSLGQMREFLFGEKLNRVRSKDGKVKRLRPEEAEDSCLNLTPLTDTSKPPRQWTELVKQGKDGEATPATGKITLSILANENPAVADQVRMVRDFRFLDKALTSVLSPQTEDGRYVSGLGAFLCSDGRVRTYLIPTAETGRVKSRRPNLQNITKGRDKDYKRLLGQAYKYKLRSMFMAAPGHVLIEADYAGAELYGMATMSGDPNMIDHATRTQLPEEDERYYDIHSNVAKLAFQLDCEPTKSGLDMCDAVVATIEGEVKQASKGQIYVGSVLHTYRKDQQLRCKPGQLVKLGAPLAGGKEFLRTIAKTVIFGIAYGRGAKAIAFAAREQGIQISEADAQAVIDAIFTMYPGLIPFFQECEERSVNERWLQHCFGRLRRFPLSMDDSIRGEFQRQAKNFPIQGMIASAVNRALAYLEWYGRENPGLFKILLQIHDAVLLEVPYEHVEFVAQNVMPWAMRDMVPIYPTTMSGLPTGRGPFYLGFEAECFEHWGEKIDAGRAAEIGLTRPKYSREGVVIKYFQAA